MRILIVFILFGALACKKEKSGSVPVFGELIQSGANCFPNSWIVKIESADRYNYEFICSQGSTPPTTGYNCENAVYIINVPPSLAQAGKKVRFTRWKNHGGNCSSSTFTPNYLEVYDLSAY